MLTLLLVDTLILSNLASNNRLDVINTNNANNNKRTQRYINWSSFMQVVISNHLNPTNLSFATVIRQTALFIGLFCLCILRLFDGLQVTQLQPLQQQQQQQVR
jgi:hypothetical protein